MDKLKNIASEYGVSAVPSVYLFIKGKAVPYQGFATDESLIKFVKKQLGPAVITLKSKSEVDEFIDKREVQKHTLSTVHVVGFFSEHEDMEEDEYNEFVETAEKFKANPSVHIAVVTDKKVASWYKKNKTIDRTPSVLLVGENNLIETINLDDFIGEKIGIQEWIHQKSIPLVQKITASNFPMYEKLGLPMLMMFLDLDDEEKSSRPGIIVGGRSGGILNEVLLDEFREAAKEHKLRISFVFADGTLHADQMRSLGLYGGKERLPSIAFNTKDRSVVPFPEELPINKDTILQFTADFLSGKLKNASDAKELAKKALQVLLCPIYIYIFQNISAKEYLSIIHGGIGIKSQS